MPFHLEEDPSRRLVRVTLEGGYDKAEIEAMVERARASSAKNRFNILYDMRRWTPGAINIADMFWLPRHHPALRAAGAGSVRVAALHEAKLGDIASFWEDTFRNAGLRARAFTDETAALAWLAVDEP
jgi:hypothetical protein